MIFNRNRYKPVILIMGGSLLVFTLVTILKNLKIYIVFSSGPGPFLLIGLLSLFIVYLYAKGQA